MSSVDSRIVTMKFDNAAFEQKAAASLSTLAKIKAAMSFDRIGSTAQKALGGVTSLLNKFGFKKDPFLPAQQGLTNMQNQTSQLVGGVTSISSSFLALSTVAITAISNIVNRMVDAGLSFAKSFTFAPVMDGLHEYETNLKSIQTVQANTDQPLSKINASLEELNRYSDQTIYNFSEMAKNVGTFTAAGVDLETSVSSIKGIANLAALSGSSSQQAATAMYQLSQSIAAGKVGLQDWNSVVNAGMGGKKLQNALAQTAIAMGEIDKNAVKMVGPMEKLTIKGQSFRESIMAQPGQESWLSSDILVNTLSTMDGRFSKAALAAEKTETGLRKFTDAQIEAKIQQARLNLEQKNGVKYTDEQFKALQKMSTMAFKSATEVKTLGQVFDVAKETIASGWSASFKNIFGNLKQAKTLFTGMSQGLNDIINKNALARNTLLVGWAEMGGRDKMIEGFKNAWVALSKVVGPVIEGFRDIFPAQTVAGLVQFTQGFADLTAKMEPSRATMGRLRDIAAGIASVFSIIGTVIGAVARGFITLFGAIGGGNGNFLEFVAGIARVITGFDEFLQKTGVVETFFQGLALILAAPLKAILAFASAIGSIFSTFTPAAADGVGKAVEGVGNRFSGLEGIIARVQQFFGTVGEYMMSLGSKIADSLGGVGDAISGAFTSETFSAVLDTINTGLFAALVLLIKKFFADGISIDASGGFFDSIKDTLGGVTDALSTMQASLKADILMKIAISIGVLAGALLVLSTIDPSAMRAALLAMGAGFAILIAAMVVLMKVMGPVGILQIYAVSSAMTKLAAAMLILAFAVKIFASMELGDMLRGLTGVALALFILQKALIPLAANSKGMLKASASLILVGIALNILGFALKLFATMSWEEMARGLAGVVAMLTALVVAMKLMPKGILLQATAILVLSVALNALGFALKLFATMSWEEMGRGMAILASALGIIAIAMRLMPKNMLLQAVALNAVASAMVILGGALKVMGGMSPEAIAKALITLGGAMLILAIGLKVMSGSLMGAAALTITALALAVLIPQLIVLGSLSWETIIKGLVALAGIFTVLGLAGLILAPILPVIIGLAAALLVIGAALALVGAGALAFGIGFSLVVATGAAAAGVMTALLNAVIQAIPPAMAAFGQGVVAFAQAIGQGAPRIAAAFGKILVNIISTVQKNIPKIVALFAKLLDGALKILVSGVPKIANAGLQIILGLLKAVESHVGDIVDTATQIIVKFLQALGRNMPKIADAGAKLIIELIRGTSQAIRANSGELGAAAAELGAAIISGLGSAIAGGASIIKDKLVDIAKGALEAAKNFFGVGGPSKTMRDDLGRYIPQGMAEGIDKDSVYVDNAMGRMSKRALETVRATMSGLNDEMAMSPNMNPTITPVLDLSHLSREATKMSALLATSPIAPTMSYNQALDISAQKKAEADAAGEGDNPTGGGDTYNTYEHHIHSPKALNTVDIYRDGKSLLALTKGELTR